MLALCLCIRIHGLSVGLLDSLHSATIKSAVTKLFISKQLAGGRHIHYLALLYHSLISNATETVNSKGHGVDGDGGFA